MVTTATRFLVTLTAVLLVGGPAPAQPPTAPPPQLALAELVKEYRRFGLPVPPPDAELVRIEWWISDDMNPYVLGLRMKPAAPGADPRYLLFGHWETDDVDRYTVEPVAPAADTLHRTNMYNADLLGLAIQCQILGWNDFARELAARAREESCRPLADELTDLAWKYWDDRLTQPGTDRGEVLLRLRAITDEHPRFRTPENQTLFRDLESTLARRTAKPGSVEALIDSLTELSDPWEWYRPETTHQGYRKLVELGLDAVPVLIEHARDARLTRVTGGPAFDSHLRIGHVVGRLLSDLAGGRGFGSTPAADPEKVREWWAEARRVGEERWLVEHALPRHKPREGESTTPNAVIARVIGAKYPARLSEVYQTIFRKQSWVTSESYTAEIVASALPREKKIALFEDGARHKDWGHRFHALDALGQLDRAALGKHLLPILESFSDRATNRDYAPGGHGIVLLVWRANDPECWDALVDAAKKVPVDTRMDIVWELGRAHRVTGDPLRRERLRCLAQFLRDRAEQFDVDGSPTEVRDFAASQMAGLLGSRLGYDPVTKATLHRDRDPLTRFALRAAVRQAAERELARPAK
jgi:hypothetical protein